MKKRLLSRVHIASLALTILSLAFTYPAHAITIDWATIGDAGNADDIHGDGYGGVAYEYRISKHEVTNAQYVEFLNAVGASDPYALYNPEMSSNTRGGITRSGSDGSYTYAVKADAVGQGPGGTDYDYANKPVNYVSWYDTIRFANWLTSGATEIGTYEIVGGGTNSGAVTVPDHATLVAGQFFLPTEDEWYKAAYFDGSVYYDYAAGTDAAPDNNLPSADTGNSANYWATGSLSYPLTDVGAYSLSTSPYGTLDQGGNLWEWNETLTRPGARGVRGGSWGYTDPSRQASSVENDSGMANEIPDLGFRLASTNLVAVPEPSTYALGGLGLLVLGLFGKRRRPSR